MSSSSLEVKTMMKLPLGLALLVAGVVALGAQAAKPQGTAPPPPGTKVGAMPNKTVIEKTLMDTEQKINEAFVKNDLPAIKALVATEGVMADASGFMSMAEFEKMFKPGMSKITDSKLTGFKVLWLDDTSAVLTYTWTGKGTFMDQPVASPAVCSTVYTNRGGKWVAVYHQETQKAPETPKK
jgi:uncharacterized protein DUF4440